MTRVEREDQRARFRELLGMRARGTPAETTGLAAPSHGVTHALFTPRAFDGMTRAFVKMGRATGKSIRSVRLMNLTLERRAWRRHAARRGHSWTRRLRKARRFAAAEARLRDVAWPPDRHG